MKSDPIAEKVCSIFEDVLEIKLEGNDLSMENEPRWDSLKHIQLLAAIEKNFSIEIEYGDSLTMTSLKNAITVVKKYKRGK